MKKLLPFALLLTIIIISLHVNGQYCGNSGPNVGTANRSITMEGFYPPDDSFPCAIIGVPYDTAIQAHTPSVAISGTTTYPLKYITIDTLNNLPCGLCWATDTPNNQIDANATRLVRFTGTTYDAPGLYVLHIIVSATVSVAGLPITVHDENLSAQGLHFELRVRIPNDTCIAVDTLAPGNVASSYHALQGPITTPSITGNASICSGASTTLTASGSNYAAYAWSNGTFAPSVNVSNTGTYSVTVFENCSSASASVNVINPTLTAPTVTANGPTTFCQGGSVTLNAGSGYSSYSWSGGGTGQTLNVTQGGNYTCTVTESGCTVASNAVAITTNTSPTPTVTASGPVSFCQGSSVTLDAGSGYSSYAWSNNATTQTVVATTSGNYKCTVTQNGCSGTSNTITVTVNNPTPTIVSSGPLTFCAGGRDTLNAGSGYSAYLWSNNATTQSIVVTQSGQYTCTVTQGGCPGTSNTVTITVGTSLSPTITAAPSFTICTGASTTLDAGSGYGSYSWSSGSTSETAVVSIANTYTVTVTQGGCSGTASATVSVGNFPLTVNISPAGPISVCAGTPVTLDAGAGYTSYSWSNTSASETIQPTTTGTYTVTASQNACSGTSSVNVTFNPLPQPGITSPGPLSVCAGGVVTLDAGAGYTTYAWSNGDNTQTSQVSTADTYIVTVTDSHGCSGSDSAVVVVSAPPVPVITGPASVCSGGSFILGTASTYASYLWSDGDTTATTTVNGTGPYNVSVTTVGGCSGSSSAGYVPSYTQLPVEYVSQSQASDTNTLLQVSPTGSAYIWLSQTALGGAYTQESATTESFIGSCSPTPTFYTAVVNQGGCNDTARVIQVTCLPLSGVNSIPALIGFAIKPNPANDVLNISYQLAMATIVKISIFDLTGRKVMDVINEAENVGSQQHEVRVNDLAPGIYLLNLSGNLGNSNSKFVKQ